MLLHSYRKILFLIRYRCQLSEWCFSAWCSELKKLIPFMILFLPSPPPALFRFPQNLVGDCLWTLDPPAYLAGNSPNQRMVLFEPSFSYLKWETHLFLISPTFYPLLMLFCTFLSVHAKSLQSCLTPCDPMDCSPPGSSVHGNLQAGILEWLALPRSS